MRADSAPQQIRFLAMSVFGDIDFADRWLNTPNGTLGGLTPTRCAQTDSSILLVFRALRAIENGAVA